jgi:hypothetical protein
LCKGRKAHADQHSQRVKAQTIDLHKGNAMPGSDPEVSPVTEYLTSPARVGRQLERYGRNQVNYRPDRSNRQKPDGQANDVGEFHAYLCGSVAACTLCRA